MPNWIECEADLRDQGYSVVSGVDEAGRGPLAGPVVAAAVVLPPLFDTDSIADSKLLSEKTREKLYNHIIKHSLSFAIESVSPGQIDKINVLQATFQAMRAAISRLSPAADFVIVDGNIPIRNLKLPQRAVIRGDQKILSVACASILAKVHRDRLMKSYDNEFPQYGFAQHKGYPTKLHRKMILKYGPCKIHRKSFNLLGNEINLELEYEQSGFRE